MGEIDSFVSEYSSDFVHSVQSSDDELLEIQFRGDSEVKIEIEGVVMGDERLRGGSSGDLVHHRSLDLSLYRQRIIRTAKRRTYLEETKTVQVLSNVVDNSRPLDEDLSSLGVHNEVEISLSMPLLLILESKVLLRKLMKIRREEDHRRGGDGELGFLGSQRLSGDSDDISSSENGVKSFKVFWRFRFAERSESARRSTVLLRGYRMTAEANVLDLGHNLNFRTLRMQVVKDEFSTTCPNIVDSTSDRDDDIVELSSGVRKECAVFLDVGGESDRDMELVRVRGRRDEGSLRVGDRSEFLNRSSPQFVVFLLQRSFSLSFDVELYETDVGRYLFLVFGSVGSGGFDDGRRSSSGLIVRFESSATTNDAAVDRKDAPWQPSRCPWL